MKKNIAPRPTTTERTSEVQMSLKYAQQVAATVKARRRAALERRRAELEALPVTHVRDVELRDELIRGVNAEIKQLEEPDE